MGFQVVMTMLKAGIGPDMAQSQRSLTRMGVGFRQVVCQREEEIIAAAAGADAIICLNEPFTRRVIASLERCRLIATPKTGLDNIDVAAATEYGILISHCPEYALDEVSDQALGLILICARKLFQYHQATRQGKWFITLPPVYRLRGQTLGIIGLGWIGRRLVPKARALGLRVIAYSPTAPPQVASRLKVKLVELEQLLREADFISLHATLRPESRGMLGREHFRLMKPTAYLINTARGALVDETALIEALREGWIAGAGLDVVDVIDPFPPSRDNPLLGMDNVVITAHSAWYSEEAVAELGRIPGEEIRRVLRGSFPRYLANPEARTAYQQRWG